MLVLPLLDRSAAAAGGGDADSEEACRGLLGVLAFIGPAARALQLDERQALTSIGEMVAATLPVLGAPPEAEDGAATLTPRPERTLAAVAATLEHELPAVCASILGMAQLGELQHFFSSADGLAPDLRAQIEQQLGTVRSLFAASAE